MKINNIKLRWTLWAYLFAVSVKCLLAVWHADKSRCYALLKSMRLAYRRKESQVFFKLLFEQVLVPNYRLKADVRLGRPSVSIYRKFSEIFKYFELKNLVLDQEKIVPRYLLIRDGAMGDVLMLTPIVSALHAAHDGEISIDIATHSKAVFDNNPYVKQVIESRDLARSVTTYDVVVDFNGVYERMPNTHPVKAYAKLILNTNGHFDKKLQLYPSQADVYLMDEVINKIGGPFVVVHQFSHDWPNRTIPTSVWAQTLEAISTSRLLKVIYVGTAQDLAPVCSAQQEDHRGRYTLQQLSLLISKSEGFIGGDSGPSHVAATTDVPIVVFYTCAHHEARMPLRDGGKFLPIYPDIDCYGCLSKSTIPRPGYFCERGDNICVTLLAGQALSESVHNFFVQRV